MASAMGVSSTGTVAITVFVAVSKTDTLAEPKLATYPRDKSGVRATATGLLPAVMFATTVLAEVRGSMVVRSTTLTVDSLAIYATLFAEGTGVGAGEGSRAAARFPSITVTLLLSLLAT